ncbi:MAG: hydroxymethylbilane synthase [Endozoicomonadaceae bacterium]|nr:hydroxymethylbilane synthase [Endozoicomonadaceae bacterium]
MSFDSSTINSLRIATRKSSLALWQANEVANKLKALYPKLNIILVKLVSEGDKFLETPLTKIGGKALFTKELERALLSGEADIAVHSMKDVPAIIPEGLSVPVICKRENPQDAFVSNNYKCLDDLPENAVVGTSSLRRQCQLLALRPDLTIRFLRGNINTRLNKLDAGLYDAIILATAGLIRLDMRHRITQILPPEISLPAAGQGAMGIEICSERQDILQLIQPLHDNETAFCVEAERTVSQCLNGSCHVPLASFSTLKKGILNLRALIGKPDASVILRAELSSNVINFKQTGQSVAKMLIEQGGQEILSQYSQNS